MRLFFAAPMPESSRAELARLRAELEATRPPHVLARFLEFDKQHVTLKFLGDVGDSELQALSRLLIEAAEPTGAVECELGRVTGFGSEHRARVLVLGLSDAGERLAALASRLEAGARALGLRREERRFTAHVTLARLPRPANVRAWVSAVSGAARRVSLDRVCLYRSELGPSGSRYELVAEHGL